MSLELSWVQTALCLILLQLGIDAFRVDLETATIYIAYDTFSAIALDQNEIISKVRERYTVPEELSVQVIPATDDFLQYGIDPNE